MKSPLFAVAVLLLLAVQQHAQTIDFNSVTSTFTISNVVAPYPPQGKGVPRWGQYLWEFGDGHYLLTDNAKPQTHWFAAPGTYTVTLTLTPLYAKAKPLQVTRQVTVAQGKTTTVNYATKDWIELVINSPGEVVPEHTLRLIAQYKAPLDLTGGYLLLFFNQKGEVPGVSSPLSVVDANTRFYNKEQGVPGAVSLFLRNGALPGPQANAQAQKLAKEFRDARVFKVGPMKKGEQRRIFWDLNVGAALKNKRDKNIEMSVVALWVPNGAPFSTAKNKDQLDLRVSSVYDPNHLRVRPGTLYFRKNITRHLRYVLDFQNEGDGAVQDVVVRLPLGRQHDLTSFSMEKITPYCPECKAGVNNADSVCWEKTVDENTLVLRFRNIGLDGTGSKRLLESKKSTKARVIFNLNAQDRRIPYTRTKAQITFQGNPKPVVTDVAQLKWRQRSWYLKPGWKMRFNQSPGPEREFTAADKFNLAVGFQNSAVGAGVGWGWELSTIHHRFYQDTLLTFFLNTDVPVPVFQSKYYDIHYLDLKAIGLFNVTSWFRFNAGVGVSMPAFARLDARSSSEFFDPTTVFETQKFGLFNRRDDAFIYNQPLLARTLPGLSTSVGAEIGLLQDVALGLSYEWRYYPRFYGGSCTSLSNLNATLRFRILPVRGR